MLGGWYAVGVTRCHYIGLIPCTPYPTIGWGVLGHYRGYCGTPQSRGVRIVLILPCSPSLIGIVDSNIAIYKRTTKFYVSREFLGGGIVYTLMIPGG